MDPSYITRNEYEEHNRRMEDEHGRTNKRLSILEETVETLRKLVVSVELLANNMQQMLKELEKQGERLDKQGERLDKLEDAPAEQWKGMKQTAINTAVGALAGAFIVGVVILIAQYLK